MVNLAGDLGKFQIGLLDIGILEFDSLHFLFFSHNSTQGFAHTLPYIYQKLIALFHHYWSVTFVC